MSKFQKIDAINDAIRAKVYEISAAHFAGVRGQAILDLESEKRALKRQHAQIMKG